MLILALFNTVAKRTWPIFRNCFWPLSTRGDKWPEEYPQSGTCCSLAQSCSNSYHQNFPDALLLRLGRTSTGRLCVYFTPSGHLPEKLTGRRNCYCSWDCSLKDTARRERCVEKEGSKPSQAFVLKAIWCRRLSDWVQEWSKIHHLYTQKRSKTSPPWSSLTGATLLWLLLVQILLESFSMQ